MSHGSQANLFAPALPSGLTYRAEFLGHEEERSLLAHIAELPLQEAQYRQYTARRRTVNYRPYPWKPERRKDVFALELEPRSAYILRDEARWGWQHSIPPAKVLRHSITFRTAHATGTRRREPR